VKKVKQRNHHPPLFPTPLTNKDTKGRKLGRFVAD